MLETKVVMLEMNWSCWKLCWSCERFRGHVGNQVDVLEINVVMLEIKWSCWKLRW